MDELSSLFARYEKSCNARFWIGDCPQIAHELVASAIASKIGYPTSPQNPFADNSMKSLDRGDAAILLAKVGTTSLAYEMGLRFVRSSEINLARKALETLDRRAWFYTNGTWLSEQSGGWTPLSQATFDCGVIGWDRTNAFVFWVEEED